MILAKILGGTDGGTKEYDNRRSGEQGVGEGTTGGSKRRGRRETARILVAGMKRRIRDFRGGSENRWDGDSG